MAPVWTRHLDKRHQSNRPARRCESINCGTVSKNIQGHWESPSIWFPRQNSHPIGVKMIMRKVSKKSQNHKEGTDEWPAESCTQVTKATRLDSNPAVPGVFPCETSACLGLSEAVWWHMDDPAEEEWENVMWPNNHHSWGDPLGGMSFNTSSCVQTWWRTYREGSTSVTASTGHVIKYWSEFLLLI